MRRSALVALAAVVGPGLLAGLSDDDPAGITTYSILGAEYGYELLWVLALSTAALIVFHELGARMGVVTGRDSSGSIRERFGVRVGARRSLPAGREPRHELRGVRRRRSGARSRRRRRSLGVPVAAVDIVSARARGRFRRIEHVLIALAPSSPRTSSPGSSPHPDWGAAAHGLVVPSLPAAVRRCSP